MPAPRSILLTGATGLLGRDVLARFLARDERSRVLVLVRDAGRWMTNTRSIPGIGRVTPVVGDLRADGLGLNVWARQQLRRSVTAVLHLAADTRFSRPLDDARAVNTAGTMRVLELAAECAAPVRFAYVSTAFVAGRRVGVIGENEPTHDAGWANAYEQSKYEAEALVRAHANDWTILRSSTVVCDDAGGGVTQFNAVHRALQLYRNGLAAMIPGVAGSTVDAVATDYVGDAIARLALSDDLHRRAVHLCAGTGALPLEELLEITWERWAALDPAWRRRGIPRPALADLRTYALFEQSVEEIGDPSLKRVLRALSHFAPQLAMPKRFETTTADALLGAPAPAVRDFWIPMIDNLAATNWGAATPRAA
ncbi:MAG TPA: SDR family oxidoreductase [Gemmatimonadaceae bacterium]